MRARPFCSTRPAPIGAGSRSAFGALALVVSWLALSANPASAAPPKIPSSCPSAAEVSTALGVTVSKPAARSLPNYLRCTYPMAKKGPYGISSIMKPTITWMKDSPAAFAQAERSAVSELGAKAVHGLGNAAYEVTYGLFVLGGTDTNTVAYEVTAQVSLARLEALMRELV